MGQWNSLHLFDDTKFYKTLVPIFKNDKEQLADYFKKGSAIIEHPELFTEERVDKIMSISNALTHSFRVYPTYIKALDNCINAEETRKVRNQFSEEAEDFNNLLLFTTFQECALVKPYFMLGYRHMTSMIDYNTKDSATEILFKKLLYQQKKGSIISLLTDDGIRNWLTNSEVKQLLENYPKDVVPSKSSRLSSTFVRSLHKFLELADNNNLGVIACLDIDIYNLSDNAYRLDNIDWRGYENVTFK